MFIYAIRRKSKPEHCLIGQTIRKDTTYRWNEHSYRARSKTHGNKHFESAWHKYGEDDFEFVTLAEAQTQNELNRLEWIYEKMFEGNITWNP